MNELSTERTPAVIAGEIRYIDGQAKKILTLSVIEIGNRLAEAKEMVGHGAWGEWIRTELGYSQSTAQDYMRIAKEYGTDQMGLFGGEANSQAIGNLSYTKALRLLALPAEEREDFAAEVDAAHISTRELEEAIRQRDEAKAALEKELAENEGSALRMEEMQEQLDTLRESLEDAAIKAAEAKARVKELESRPVEVAVEKVDATAEQLSAARSEAAKAAADKAEKDAKKAAAEHQKALDAAVKEAEDAKKALQEAQKALTAAQDAAKKAKADAEAGARQSRAAQAEQDPAVARFKLLFRQWQETLSQMLDELRSAQEDNRGKLRAALEAAVENAGKAVAQ